MDLDQIGIAFQTTFGKDFDRRTLAMHVETQLQLREDAFYTALISQMNTERLLVLRDQLNEKSRNNNPGHAPPKTGKQHSGFGNKGR